MIKNGKRIFKKIENFILLSHQRKLSRLEVRAKSTNMIEEAHKTSEMIILHYILHLLIVFFIVIPINSKSYPAKPYGQNFV